ncbi:TonB-dependent receptor [Moraxella caprae]|uniref:TonB-dependent receptor n=1 Tax=Moraxella caprae TaxID=90240 RepID=UPI00041FD7CB|nr:TonB-dependent receptor [Moraxella caprae]
MRTYKTLSCAVLAILANTAFAHETPNGEPHVVLEGMHITLDRSPVQGHAFVGNQKASDTTVSKSKLQQRSATLGNALSGELGIHSNPFGGGASAPVVRGQEGVRVKVLNNALGVTDMSNISPDHAVSVDTLLASRVELVRGASTLMHANASPAGVINVVDAKIPTRMPSGLEGEVLTRHTTGSNEKLVTSSLALPMGERVAMRVEGLARDANPYNVPAIKFDDETLKYLPDSYNNAKVNTIGLSYIGNQGYLGIAHTLRRENYGLVGHNHKFDECSAHILEPDAKLGRGRHYLTIYPHLMDDSDMIDALHFHCGNDHEADPTHSHDNVYGHKHNHNHKAPWLEMRSRSTSLQGELNNPFVWLDKIKLNLGQSDYKHTEFDEGKPIMTGSKERFVQGNPVYYGNDARLGKLSFHHTLFDKYGLVWGADYQHNRTHALIPSIKEKQSNKRPLVENTQESLGLFALTNAKFGNLTLETGYRHENAKIGVHYDLDEIDHTLKSFGRRIRQEYPNLTPYKNHATSYAITALWDITPKLRLDTTYSHNERIPTPMELYYHGKHLATNSFMFGNKALNKEKSDNLEFGANFKGDKWSVKGSVYGNNFDNYIHPENLYKVGNLAMRRFTQSKAKIRGAELEIGYQFNPNYKVSVFGDKVRGRLYGFDPIFVGNIYGDRQLVGYEDPEDCGWSRTHPDYEEECAIYKRPIIGQETITRPDRHAPRMSPDRLGFRINGEHGNFSSSLEFSKVFAQNRTSESVAAKYDSECPYHKAGRDKLCPIYINEDATKSYNLLNVGLDYHRHFGDVDTTWSLRGNNLLNEKVYIHNSFLPFVPQQGRNVSVSVNIKY